MWLGHCCKKGTALSNHCSLPFVCGALGTELSPGTCMQGKHSAAELHAYLDFSFCCCNFYCFFLRQRLEKTGRLNTVKMTNLSNVIYIFNLALLEPQWMPPHPLTERISLCRSALKLSLCTQADQAGFESLAIPLPQPATCYIRLKVRPTRPGYNVSVYWNKTVYPKVQVWSQGPQMKNNTSWRLKLPNFEMD